MRLRIKPLNALSLCVPEHWRKLKKHLFVIRWSGKLLESSNPCGFRSKVTSLCAIRRPLDVTATWPRGSGDYDGTLGIY